MLVGGGGLELDKKSILEGMYTSWKARAWQAHNAYGYPICGEHRFLICERTFHAGIDTGYFARGGT